MHVDVRASIYACGTQEAKNNRLSPVRSAVSIREHFPLSLVFVRALLVICACLRECGGKKNASQDEVEDDELRLSI